jgi:MFS family permease
MLAVLRQRNFLLIWVSGLISMTGDWILYIALPIYVYTITGSPMATSGAVIAELAPALLLGSVAGVYADRWPRKTIMLASNLILAVTLLPLLLVRSADFVWIVYLVGFVQSTVAQFANPAEAALLPTLVREEQLVTANSLSALNMNVSRLVGPTLGGLIAAATGIRGVTLIDSATFLAAASLVAFLALPRDVTQSHGTEAEMPQGIWHQWVEGMRLVRRSRALTVLFGLFALMSMGEGVMATMFVIWVKQVIHGTALQLGWFMSAQAVGGILAGLVIGSVGSRVVPRRLAWLGSLCFALIDIALFTYPLAIPGVWLGLLLIALVGLPAAASGSSYTTLLQLSAPDAFRGRVFGARGTVSALAMLIGSLLAGAIGSILGPVAMLDIFQGGGYLVASFVLLLTLSHFALEDRQAPVPQTVRVESRGA